MARKKKFSYKGLVINKEDLAITKIGEMPNESKSPIFLFFLFGIFIAFVFYLPDIMDYITYKNTPVENPVVSSETPQDNENISEQDIVYYDINPDVTVDIENGVLVKQFTFNENTFYFTVTNTLSNRFSFNEHNYFIEFYDANKTLLERIILKNEELLGSGDVKEYNYSVLPTTITNATQFVLVEKSEDDYPNIELELNDSNEALLVCKKNEEEITYTFRNDQLASLSDIYTRSNTVAPESYATDLMRWQALSITYNNIEGVTSLFSTNASGFVMTTTIELKNAKLDTLKNDAYYPYGTRAKVVDFEMKARGFTCS